MRRALHYVFKVGDRAKSVEFYTEHLGMKVLRHEEFSEGCEATCNGPYSGKWSKTMIGYGDESDSFVLELTYNYGIGGYKLGNDFGALNILQRSKDSMPDPEGRQFNFVTAEDIHRAESTDPVESVAIAVSNLEESIKFWSTILDMQLVKKSDQSALLTYAGNQCHLELNLVDKIERGTAFGRMAFSCPTDQLSSIEDKVRANGNTILTPKLSLETPGKATVHVVIVADPDNHEICFVGEEAFNELSATDPKADQLLKEAIASDHSAKWFAKKGGKTMPQY